MRKVFLGAAVALSLAACSNSSTMVLERASADYSAQAVTLVYDDGTVDVEDGKVEKLNAYMADAFADRDFAMGTGGMTVKYGFMGYDEGSQAMRYLAGPLAGGAKMVLVAEFFDEDMNPIDKIQTEGSVSGGFFGGDSDSAIKGAAKQVAKYAEENYAAGE